MSQVTDATLARMVDAIVDEVSPERVILFGSHARGDEMPQSDVDFLVIQSEPFNAVGQARRPVRAAQQAVGPIPGSDRHPALRSTRSRLLAGLAEPRCRASFPRGQGPL